MGMAAETQFHVLAVDDSLIDRKLIERLLKTSSYQVTTVDSGSKALEFLGLMEEDVQRNPNPTSDPNPNPNPNQASVSSNHQQEVEVNLIITDYCMPGMTGYDLLKKIKESSSLKDIPVVIMSSENVPSRINRCLEEGAEEFFLKPVQLADVKKLKPHLLKGRSREQSPPPPQQSQIHQQQTLLQQVHQQQQQEVHQQQQQQQAQQSQQSQQPNNKRKTMEEQQPNNKRKTMEEALSPERTRPRYSGLAVV